MCRMNSFLNLSFGNIWCNLTGCHFSKINHFCNHSRLMLCQKYRFGLKQLHSYSEFDPSWQRTVWLVWIRFLFTYSREVLATPFLIIPDPSLVFLVSKQNQSMPNALWNRSSHQLIYFRSPYTSLGSGSSLCRLSVPCSVSCMNTNVY